jgi:hypothetical protein
MKEGGTLMRGTGSFARTLTRLTLVVLLLSCRAQTQSAVPALPAEIPAAADRYTFLIMGNRAGQQAVWTTPDGQLHIFFQFNDRGRGPQTTSTLKLNANGLPIEESVRGNDYYKSRVDELYTLASGTARWKSSIEVGEKKLTAPAVYFSINGAPAELGILAQAALGNAGKIALLPDGEATIDRVAELNLEIPGRKKNVSLYAITGLDFAPTYVWLDDRRDFFAQLDPWETVIPEGWEGAIKPLQAAQDKAAQGRSARKQAEPPSARRHRVHPCQSLRCPVSRDSERPYGRHRRQSHSQRRAFHSDLHGSRRAGDRWHGADIVARPVGHARPRWG